MTLITHSGTVRQTTAYSSEHYEKTHILGNVRQVTVQSTMTGNTYIRQC